MGYVGQRALRKFVKNRLAVVAALIIAVYLVIALGVLVFGLIPKATTTARIGPGSTPGWGGRQAAEKRVEDADFLLTRVRRALDRKNPADALAEIELGERRPAAKGPDDLRRVMARAEAILKELDKSEDINEEPALWPRVAELEATVAELFAPLGGWSSFKQELLLMLGTDRQGRSISARAFYAVKVAVQIGVVTALVSVVFGSLLGGAAAFFGGWVDHLVIWLYSTLSSVPHLVLLGVLVYLFTGTVVEQSLIPIYVAFCATFWIGPCRVVRGEVLRIKELDYVQAATALGQNRLLILIRHVMPNVSHLILVNFSLLFIGAIKSEVILTFLGLGVKNEPSWGTMIQQSSAEVVNEFFWQIGAATGVMFFLVLAFNIFTDALQDALDPKHIA
ncbi:MAG: ABC transporter permease [Planctomycetota bacterium]|jgi:peptide/nickel transport system permease protein